MLKLLIESMVIHNGSLKRDSLVDWYVLDPPLTSTTGDSQAHKQMTFIFN